MAPAKIARVFHVSLDELHGLFTDGGGAAGDMHVPERGGAEGMERAAGVRAAFRPSWAKLVCVRELDQRLPQPASASG